MTDSLWKMLTASELRILTLKAVQPSREVLNKKLHNLHMSTQIVLVFATKWCMHGTSTTRLAQINSKFPENFEHTIVIEIWFSSINWILSPFK